MECFTDDFSQFCSTFSNFFPMILSQKVVWQLVRRLVYSPFANNNLVPFHLWWTEIVLKC